ncbi:uncharacterized protein [Venturia canescens]|uniref:uncharacterized protein n=1 Tax=Venturia canescens TaxID=32260 RepID=UPI001C9CDE01|nr:uncharacterized protein LOC122414288 [Venturia canescens]
MTAKTGNMDDFNFYLKLSKPLVLNLPNAKDRAMAALWLKKLVELNSRHTPDSAADNIHVEYLKLLLLAMQTDRLTGIFGKPPPSGDLGDIVPGKHKAQDMISLVKTRTSSQQGDETVTYGHPRVMTSIGGDLCEYVSVQEIPNFGIHGYYALSNEPLSEWSNIGRRSVESKESDCFKHASEKAERKKAAAAKQTPIVAEEQNETAAATVGSDSTGVGQISRRKHERTKHSEKSLQKIFQAQRSEIAGVETRPCWGRIRYIDRLIDESPHVVADLDLSEADAMLHLYRDTKFRKSKHLSKAEKASKICSISSRRRNVEKRLDLPPCAIIPDEDDYERFAETETPAGSRTCLPANFESDDCRNNDEDEIIDYDRAPYDCPDDQYESELLERTEYATWPDGAHECDYTDQYSEGLEESYSNVSQPSMEAMNPESFRDTKLLISDPERRAPPSSGKVKVPRKKRHSLTDESWDPPGHSTSITKL